MFTKRGWLIMFIVLLASVGDFYLVMNEMISVGCLFVIVQNVLFPILVAPFMMENIKFSFRNARQLEWMLTGSIIGGIPTAAMIIATGIHYFLLGGIEKLQTIKGFNKNITGGILITDISFMVFLWFCLSLVGAFSGLVSSGLFSRYLKK